MRSASVLCICHRLSPRKPAAVDALRARLLRAAFLADRSVKRVERPESGTVTVFSKQVPCLPLLA